MKEKLNIGEFNDSFMPVMDGVGNVVKNYAVELNKLNHKAYAIVPGYKEFPTFDKDNGIYYTIRGKEYYPLKSLRPYGITVFPNKTKRIINEIPFDIVHTHCPTFSAKLALQIAKRRDIPIISTFHTFFKDDLMELLPEKLANTVVKNGMKFYYKCDEVWTPSYASKRKIEKDYYFSNPIRVVENGCDMVAPIDNIEFQALRYKGYSLCNTSIDTPIFIYVGQHKDEKNIPLILETMKALKSRGNSFKMIFVGDGHKKESYEKYVADNNLSSFIQFLGRITDREKLRELYCASYLFLFPSLYDTSCLVMREAACFELPLVYVDIACTSEGITDGENGYIIKNDVADFTRKLEAIIKNPEQRNYCGMNAKRDLYRSWKDVSMNVEKLYYEIIERKKSK